jgi:hypothetical protein
MVIFAVETYRRMMGFKGERRSPMSGTQSTPRRCCDAYAGLIAALDPDTIQLISSRSCIDERPPMP